MKLSDQQIAVSLRKTGGGEGGQRAGFRRSAPVHALQVPNKIRQDEWWPVTHAHAGGGPRGARVKHEFSFFLGRSSQGGYSGKLLCFCCVGVAAFRAQKILNLGTSRPSRFSCQQLVTCVKLCVTTVGLSKKCESSQGVLHPSM
jgi:hypothetical protein